MSDLDLAYDTSADATVDLHAGTTSDDVSLTILEVSPTGSMFTKHIEEDYFSWTTIPSCSPHIEHEYLIGLLSSPQFLNAAMKRNRMQVETSLQNTCDYALDCEDMNFSVLASWATVSSDLLESLEDIPARRNQHLLLDFDYGWEILFEKTMDLGPSNLSDWEPKFIDRYRNTTDE